MIPAQCTGCGKTALSLWVDMLKILPKTHCDSCGRSLRKRGGKEELIAVLLFVLVIGYAYGTAEGTTAMVILAGAVVFASYMEWWSWRSVPWDPEDDGPEAM